MMQLPAPLEGYARCIFVDGVFAPALSQACAAFDAGAGCIVASADGDAPLKLEVIFAAGEAAADTVRSQLAVQVRERARISLVERHLGQGETETALDHALTIEIAADACVDHYRVQQTGAGASWNDTLSATVAARARYGIYSVGLGGRSAQSRLNLKLAGEHAQLGLHAVNVTGGKQTHRTAAVIEHAAPHTRTEENFRGIAAGQAQLAFEGKIVVRDTARGTDSRQSLRGLIASRGARVDVLPHLEIYTDEVKCSHGATTGKLDDAMLFYLLSRGLERETAQLLLKWAFLEDVVAKIALPELRRHIEQTLAGQLDGGDTLQELL